MIRARFRCLLPVVLLAVSFVGSTAQDSRPSDAGKNQPIMGIMLDSNYARISDFLPRLRKDLTKTLPNRHKSVHAVEIDAGSPQEAELAAKKKGCDYLLRMTVSEITGVAGGVQFDGSNSFNEHDDHAREKQELMWVRMDYRLVSVKNDDVDVSGTDQVRYGEIPSAWDAMAFETTVSRAVTRVAVTSLAKLPKK